MPQAEKTKTHQWFADVPGEIRNNIYEYYFSSIRVSRTEPRSGKGKLSCKEIITAPLNLLAVSRRVKAEAEPFFWRTALFTYYASYSSDLPSTGQVNKIQSLWLRGPHRTWAGMLELVLPMSLFSNTTMRSLKIGAELDLRYGKSR